MDGEQCSSDGDFHGLIHEFRATVAPLAVEALKAVEVLYIFVRLARIVRGFF